MDNYNSTANFHIAVIKDKSLSYLDKIVYIVLCSHADNEARECSPKVATIAEEASCSPRAVHKSLNNLEKHGVVSRKRRFVDHRQISSLYKIIAGKPEQNFADENSTLQTNTYFEGRTECSDMVRTECSDMVRTECSDEGGTVCRAMVRTECSDMVRTECSDEGGTVCRAMVRTECSDTVNNVQSLNTLRIFNNSLKGEACLPASAEKESSLGNPEERTSQEEIENSLTGEALLPSSQSCKPEEEQEKPQTTENTQDSIAKTPVIKAETHKDTEKPEGGACLPAPAELEEKPLTQEEKLRRYYELRRKCEEEHRKAEAEACLPAPAEKETTPEEPKAPQTEGSTLPDYLIQQYEQKRKMIEEMMKPTKEPRYVSCDVADVVADVVADIKKPRLIKAESEKATQTPVAERKLTDNTPVTETQPMMASNSPVASSERIEHRDTPVAQARPMDACNLPVARDRHIAKTDNAPELAETSDTPVAREEPPVPKEADKSAETPNKATDKGKYSGGGSSKDVYPVDYAPDIMRPTAEYFLLKTGRKGLRWEEVSVLRKLSATQYPTRVNKEIERACERFRKRNQSLLCLTLMYIEAALKNQPTWGNKAKQKARQKAEAQSEVVEKPKTEEEIAAEEAQAKAEMECIENYLAKFAAEREERRRKWLQTWTGMKS